MDREGIQKGVNALYQVIEKKKKDNENKKMWDEDDLIQVIFTFHTIPQVSHSKPRRM